MLWFATIVVHAWSKSNIEGPTTTQRQRVGTNHGMVSRRTWWPKTMIKHQRMCRSTTGSAASNACLTLTFEFVAAAPIKRRGRKPRVVLKAHPAISASFFPTPSSRSHTKAAIDRACGLHIPFFPGPIGTSTGTNKLKGKMPVCRSSALWTCYWREVHSSFERGFARTPLVPCSNLRVIQGVHIHLLPLIGNSNEAAVCGISKCPILPLQQERAVLSCTYRVVLQAKVGCLEPSLQLQMYHNASWQHNIQSKAVTRNTKKLRACFRLVASVARCANSPTSFIQRPSRCPDT